MTLGKNNFDEKSCFHTKINFANFCWHLTILEPPSEIQDLPLDNKYPR